MSNKVDEPEDSPVVKELKAIDDEYLAEERALEAEIRALRKVYEEKQRPLLIQRAQVLAERVEDAGPGAPTGTPAVHNFWCKALKNHPALSDSVEEWDEPVLAYLRDITKEDLDPTDDSKGFKISFQFVENPFFTHEVLWKEYHTKEESPYNGEMNVFSIKSSKIDWKAGKNVTVETVQKKVKGGGAKKAKQKGREKEEPRSSFFRNFFRTLEHGMPLPDDIDLEAMELDDEEGDDDEILDMVMEADYEMGEAIATQVIPFAVRWYTGEAAPEDSDDEEEEEEEEGDDDDE